jgi:hypothetical protein
MHSAANQRLSCYPCVLWALSSELIWCWVGQRSGSISCVCRVGQIFYSFAYTLHGDRPLLPELYVRWPFRPLAHTMHGDCPFLLKLSLERISPKYTSQFQESSYYVSILVSRTDGRLTHTPGVSHKSSIHPLLYLLLMSYSLNLDSSLILLCEDLYSLSSCQMSLIRCVQIVQLLYPVTSSLICGNWPAIPIPDANINTVL